MIFFDVDTQRDFMEPDGALYVPDAVSVRRQTESLLKAAGKLQITTISSQCSHEPGDPEFAIFPPHCLDGTPGAERIFPDLPELPRREIAVNAKPDETQVEPGLHYLVKKKEFDLFSNAWLEGLRETGSFKDQECVVFGVATDYCVRACALGLAESGARVRLVQDAIQGVAEETTASTMLEFRAAGVEFTTTDEVLTTLSRASNRG